MLGVVLYGGISWVPYRPGAESVSPQDGLISCKGGFLKTLCGEHKEQNNLIYNFYISVLVFGGFLICPKNIFFSKNEKNYT